MKPENDYHAFLRNSYKDELYKESYLTHRLIEIHNKVIKKLKLENKWKFKWFMLFKHNHKKYHDLYNKYLLGSKVEIIPIKFNMMGDEIVFDNGSIIKVDTEIKEEDKFKVIGDIYETTD